MTPVRLCCLLGLVSLAACGSEIGDSCSLSTDCSPDGDRLCDTNSPGGYCTIQGCDDSSCPSGSACIRFFAVAKTNRPCDPATEDHGTNTCSPDELCSIGGDCVPRDAEVRFCMKTCGSTGDCRSEYECRDAALMRIHGGEPVPPAGEVLGPDPQPFCAAKPLKP